MHSIKHNSVIVRYGEIGLKGRNRGFFENKLISNIKSVLKLNSIDAKTEKERGRIFVNTSEKIIPLLKNVFGIVNLSYAYCFDSDFDAIKKKALEFASEMDFRTFRVSCQRTNKHFKLKSPEIEKLVGEVIFEKLNKKVDLKNPELNLQIEIHKKAYIFYEKEKAVAGLPIGIAGNVFCLFEKGTNEKNYKNSMLAACLIMKRGCKVIPVFISEKKDSINKALEKLKAFDSKINGFSIENIKEIDEKAEQYDAKAFVSAKIIKNIKDVEDINMLGKILKIPVLMPLAAYDSKEIMEKSRHYCLD